MYAFASSGVRLIEIIWKSVSYDCIIDEIAKKSTDRCATNVIVTYVGLGDLLDDHLYNTIY